MGCCFIDFESVQRQQSLGGGPVFQVTLSLQPPAHTPFWPQLSKSPVLTETVETVKILRDRELLQNKEAYTCCEGGPCADSPDSPSAKSYQALSPPPTCHGLSLGTPPKARHRTRCAPPQQLIIHFASHRHSLFKSLILFFKYFEA